MTLDEYVARLVKRAPVTTSRLELSSTPDGWVLLAVPSMRVLESWSADEEATAQRVYGMAAVLVAGQRAYATRPHGTCPRCAAPLAAACVFVGPQGTEHHWCASCQGYVQPAGPRVDSTEQLLRDRQRTDAAAEVERLRGKAT